MLLMRLQTLVAGRVGNAVIDARRNLSGVCVVARILLFLTFIGSSFPFLVLLSMMVMMVLLPDPLLWSAGALSKRRRLVHAVRDRAFLPGPPVYLGFGMG